LLPEKETEPVAETLWCEKEWDDISLYKISIKKMLYTVVRNLQNLQGEGALEWAVDRNVWN
jgi:hypothetical protein